jgi:hypothetical protein
MGWTADELERHSLVGAAINFDLGEKFASRALATARRGR